MATSKPDQWNVAIFVEEDESLGKMYRMSPSTSLVELMEIWKDEFELYGRWSFVSIKEDVLSDDDWMTLEMIGESIPNSKFITLRAELFEEPPPESVTNIYLYVNDKCHHVRVKPHEKLIEVFRRLPVKSKAFIHNGVPLDLRHTVMQAGLRNNSCIYESMHQVTVKLSTGFSKVIQLPWDSAVLHLVEKVILYEMDDFSLVYQGRHLDLQDSVTDLKHTVEVSRAEFVVHINGRRVSWRTGSRPISLPEFVSRLTFEGDIAAESLDTVEFRCTGCGRCIRHSEDDTQILPIECCSVKSMVLKAMSLSESETSRRREVDKRIQGFYDHLLQCKVNGPRSAASRRECRTMKEKLADVMDYNLIAGCGGIFLKSIEDLEAKIKTLEAEIEDLKAKNVKSKEDNDKLKEESDKMKEENNKLKEDKDTLVEENDQLHDRLGSVKLMVFYLRREFSPVPRPDVRHGNTQWSSMSFIKCRLPDVVPGWLPVEAVKDALSSFLHGEKPPSIRQRLGEVAGTTVAEVTSPSDEREDDEELKLFCAADGLQEHSWRDAGKPRLRDIRAGESVLFCGGRRRILLRIDA